MLTTIQELEREIEQFHKNIKESNELMQILMSVTSLTKTQTESFEVRTKALQDELAKLPPELCDLFLEKTEGFVQTVHDEHQSYQTTVATLIDGYADKLKKTESSLARIPSALEAQLQKDRAENVSDLKQVQEQYAADLEETNATFTKQLQAVIESIQTVPTEIKDTSSRQYSSFLKVLEKVIDVRLAQLSDIEKRIINLSQQFEAKCDSFTKKLEATNIDQLYQCCQDMNKSINTKLNLLLGGIAVSAIASIISLFM